MATLKLTPTATRQLQMLAEALIGVAEEEVIARAVLPPVEAQVPGYLPRQAEGQSIQGRKPLVTPIEGDASVGPVEVLRTPTARRAAGSADAAPSAAASLRSSAPGGQSAFADGAK